MFKKQILLQFMLVAFLALFPVSWLYSQDSGDDGWYYDKPVKSIVYKNLNNIKKSDMEGVMSSFIDKPCNDELIAEIYDRLFSLEYFENVEIKVAKADGGKAVGIIVDVEELPVVAKVIYKGNYLIHDTELKNATSMKAKDIFSESKILSDERAIRNHYIEKGYSKVSVTSETEQKKDGFVVTFNIVEGRKTVIKDIDFVGNKVVSSKTLRSKISMKKSGLFKKGAYQESAVSQDSSTITMYYMDRGYIDAHVVNVSQETEFNSKKMRDEVRVVFEIQEGMKYDFGGITFEGNRIFKDDELNARMRLKEGSVYNETKFQESKTNIQNLYYENGYTSNSFNVVPNKDPDARVVSFVMTVEERSRSHVENIIIKGNKKTKDFVIRREIPVESGDIFSNAKIMNGMRNLYSLQYFSAVNPDVKQGSEDGLVDLVFTLEEQSTTTLDFGFTFTGVTDPDAFPVSLYAKVQNSNFLGEGKIIGASTTLSTDEQSVSFNFGQNWIGSQPVSLNFSFGYSHSKNYARRNMFLPSGDIDTDYYSLEYQQHDFNFSNSIGRRWFPNFAILSLSGGLSTSVMNNIYDSALYTPMDTSMSRYNNKWVPRNSVHVSFSMDGRDIAFDPTKGWFFNERLTWTGLIPQNGMPFDWGESEFFLRTDTKLEKYFTLLNIPFSEKYSFKTIFMLYSGLSFELPVPGTTIRQSSKLYIDGMFNGRGWQIYNKTWGKGQVLFANSAELRFPAIPGVFAIDVFADAALVKDKPQDFFGYIKAEDWRFSFGPSLRFCLQQFPLRLLFANTFRYKDGQVVFCDQEGDGSYQWYNNWHFVLSFSTTNR